MAFLKNRSNWIIAILVLLNIASLASMWLFPPRPPHHRIERFLQKELNLTNEQKEQFKSLKGQHLAVTKAYHEELQKNKKQLFQELSKNPVDSILISNILEKEGEIHALLENALVEHFMDLKGICSEEQQEKLGDFFGKMTRPQGPPPLKK